MVVVRFCVAMLATFAGIVGAGLPAAAQEFGEELAQTYAGEMRAGIWYGSDVGPQASFSLIRPEVFGSNATLKGGLTANQYETGFAATLSVADAFGTGLSQDILLNGYYAKTRPELAQDVAYWGSDLSTLFGKDFGNGLTLRGGPGYQTIHVDPSGKLPLALSQDLAVNGTTARGGYIAVQVALDRSEAVAMPGSGYRLFGGVEAGQLGATTYAKLTFSGDAYGRLGAMTTLHAHARFGRGFAADGKALPIFKHFTSAGMADMRGFAAGGLGPTSPVPGSSTQSHVGGDTVFFGGVEVAHALREDEGLHLLGFIDLGNITDGDNPFDGLSQSVGIGLRWQSPLGPLDVAVSRPIRKNVTDLTETLQISFGLSF